ncbi:MAG: universal stress protein [Bacteroidetes bacterium]|nr:universal stress protein [Bacteroidota bacterium]
MIKRILVALDPDSDTVVAVQYAISIAQQTSARITGLAVVDTKNIEASSRGGAI